jgi:F0F1-type ATP synthase assembly protein I
MTELSPALFMADLPQSQHTAPPAKPAPSAQAWQRGFVAAYMVLGSAPAGAAIGYGIDHLASTNPYWTVSLALTFLIVSLVHLVKVLRK